MRKLFPDGVLMDLRRKFNTYTRSINFAGVDAPTCSSLMLGHALEDVLNGPKVQQMRLLTAVEKNKACQQELLANPSPPEHLFTDIEDFWQPNTKKVIDEMKASGKPLPLRSFIDLVKSRRGAWGAKRIVFGHCQCHTPIIRCLLAG